VRKSVRTTGADKSLDELFTAFCAVKTAEGMAPLTIGRYVQSYGVLRMYTDAKGVERTVGAITTEEIQRYITWMMTEKRKWEGHAHKSAANMTVGLSAVAINTNLKGLRTMFRYLTETGTIEDNPFDNVKSVKEPETDIFIMTEDQLRKLMAIPDRRSYAGFRDTVLMQLLLDGFFRIGEAIALKKTDIDFDSGTVNLSAKTTKSRRSRIVPISKSTVNLIRELIEENTDFASDYIFLANYGEPITRDQFRRRLTEHAAAAGIQIRVYPHLFRHTGATMFLEAGGDIRHLQRILGHADLRMVEKYTHLSSKSIKAQHDAYSPIQRLLGPMNKPRKIKR
jgi:integrase/recombinase XerD